MKRQTRKTLLNIATGIAVAATAAVVFLPAAQAAPGYATSNVNVRSGPGTNFGVVDTLVRGQQVDVQQCQGSWCFVAKPGPDGWVSSNFIQAGSGGGSSGGGSSGQPSINFGINIPGGPSINFGTGNNAPPPPVAREACFYEGSGLRGDSFCLSPGQSYELGRFSDGIGSIDNPRGYRVEVCGGNFGRQCRTYTTSANSLGFFGDDAQFVRVR